MTALWIIIAIIVVIALLLWIIAEFMFKKFFVRDNPERTEEDFHKTVLKSKNPETLPRIKADGEIMKKRPYESVTITSRDGLKLQGRVFLNPNPTNDTILLVHGYKSRAYFDFGCGFDGYQKLGLNIVLVDQRAHGDSEGKYITFGVKERFDVVDWANWLVERFGADSKLLVGGMSMGCTSVLLAAGEPDFPKAIRGLIADCGFTSAGDEFRHVMKSALHIPTFPLLNIVNIISKSRAGFTADEISTVDAVKNIKIPVYFFHGEADNFVIPEFSKRNYDACSSPDKRILLVPGADHGMSYLIDEEGYAAGLEDYIGSL
ncbi:MAG: alpha/beta hydrolase [Oscillospiraceae bacterium]|nr:alpha/beta hydrolase [Oscillospiraceae bacterium]